jgi:long-subunit acyl-CoA synthetase (AMP-forming)
MLTHDNVVSDLHAVMQRVKAFPEDVFLSFLPLSHFRANCGLLPGRCYRFLRRLRTLCCTTRTGYEAGQADRTDLGASHL